ncbi:ABC transporter substrate-binding protein [Neoroseomonas soli]|uniref:ABC transporter substrate-binding protein n=1 Tax=Neoroseomonas soli TaxID=1081025 RepID=A0A9X9WRH9_9PROT|nr:ABC transporter substrate-binding protein [Neoroseomonas soli]MBR0669758.1 ABC transporter substrate-binding protein [Neoroseomonas soli]
MHAVILQEPFRALFYAPFYAALARGDYAAQGVEVRLLSGTVPSLAKDSVLDGTADLAWGGPMRLLLAHDADPDCPLRLFGAVVMGDPFFLVGRADNPGFGLADLATMTLGTVSEVPTPWWTLQDDIRRAGLDPARVRRITDRTMAENAAAVAAGTLDVAQVFEPIATAMERAGTGHAWYAQASRGPTSYTAFYARADVIAAKRPAFEAMVRGLERTLAWLAIASPEEIAATVAPFFESLDQDIAAHAIARYRSLGVWTKTPHFPPEALARLEAAMLSAGAITRTPGYAGLVAEEVTRTALEAGGT